MITVTKEHFSPGQILASGQCFRMEEVKEGVWELVAGYRYLKIEETEEANTFRFHCREEELRDFWGPYFDLEGDYGAYKKRIDPADAYLVRAADFGWGIRILRQDLWEVIVTFIISQQNDIRRIRRNVQFLAKRYGRRCVSDEGKVYYFFPARGSWPRPRRRTCGPGAWATGAGISERPWKWSLEARWTWRPWRGWTIPLPGRSL